MTHNGCTQNVFEGRVVRAGSPQQDDADQSHSYTAQAEKADLTIIHFQNLLKHPPPARGGQKRHQPFKNKDNGNRRPEGVAVHGASYFLPGGGVAPEPEPRMVLKKSDDGSSTITSLFLLKLAL